MPATPSQLLDRVMAHLPQVCEPLRPVIAAVCGMLGLLEDDAETDFAASITIAGAEGPWLTLLAAGYGIRRATGESDASLRERLRNVEEQVTPGAIVAAADALLALVTVDTSTLVEHWSAWGQALDVDATCDVSHIYDRNPAFTLIIPDTGDAALIAAVLAEVDRIRAAGVTWWLVVEDL